MEVETFRGTAAELHAIDAPAGGGRRLWQLVPTGPAVVLGSTQPAADVDAAAAATAGVSVARRRSGGGAVWVDAGDPLWIDLWIPRGDPWWTDDVQAAFGPVGRAWLDVLGSLGAAGLKVHDGSLLCPTGSRQVCFAGVGPGEVLAGTGKIVGLSQRRTRHGARFQCAVYRRWDPEPLHAVLADPPDLDVLRSVGAGLDDIGLDDVEPRRLIDALLSRLT